MTSLLQPAPISITGVVLAGGEGRRMGGENKGLQPFAGSPMAASAVESLSLVCDLVVINANRDLSAYRAFGCEVFEDEALWQGYGPLAGMLTALDRVTTSHVLFSPCDTPNIKSEVFAQLIQMARLAPADTFYIETASGSQPLHVIMPVEGMKAKLALFLGCNKPKVMAFYQQLNAQPVYWQDEDSFSNINSPEDLR